MLYNLILDITNKFMVISHTNASTVSGLRLIREIPNTSFPTLKPLSLDALVAARTRCPLPYKTISAAIYGTFVPSKEKHYQGRNH
jgi:hypothetical protein